jgi:thiamine biosynthesis lipoprotein ApbE
VPEPGAGGGSPSRAATIADALTTAFMVLSSEEVRAFCQRTAGVEAWLLDRVDGVAELSMLHVGRG